jgi:hypothetical protein
MPRLHCSRFLWNVYVHVSYTCKTKLLLRFVWKNKNDNIHFIVAATSVTDEGQAHDDSEEVCTYYIIASLIIQCNPIGWGYYFL